MTKQGFGVLGMVCAGLLLAVPVRGVAQEKTSAPTEQSSSDWRLALQGRVDVLNINAGLLNIGNATVPIVAPGARLLDNKLFLGLGFDFGTQSDGGPKGFALSPMVNYDFITREYGALYGLGWINIGTQNPGAGGARFLFGMNVGAGIRAQVSEGLAVGTEWGWTFLIVEDGPFSEGIFGTVMLEASLGM